MLEVAEDPDEAALDHYAVGCLVGPEVTFQRTPALYAEKKRWELSFDDSPVEEVWR